MVKWADAHCGAGGWIDLAEYEDDGELIVTTVGVVTPEGTPGFIAGHLTLWQTLCDGEGIHPFHIPIGMVRSIKVLCSIEQPD